MICAVQYRTDQLRKAGITTRDHPGAVVLDRIHLGQQMPRLGDHVLARFEQHIEPAPVTFGECGETAGDFGPHRDVVHPALLRLVRHLEAAAEVEKFKVGEVLRRRNRH